MDETETETETQARPRFRSDLVAQYLEEGGVQYVDVTDPNSGATFRFYDVEYSIACAMNGDRDLDGLAEWTRAELGIETSPDELNQVVSTLADLGYLDLEADYEGEGEYVEEGPYGSYPGEEGYEGDAGAEAGADGGNGVEAGVHAGAEDDGLELGAPGAGPHAASKIEDEIPSTELELGAPGAGDGDTGVRASSQGDFDHESPTRGRIDEVELGAAGGGVDLSPLGSAAPELELGPPGGTPEPVAAAKPPVAAKKPVDEMSFEGLVEDTKVGAKAGKKPVDIDVPSADFTPPPVEMPTEAKALRPTTAKLDGEDEPTNIPKPMMEPDDDADVSVDLSAHLSLDKNEVQEAVRQSKVMSVPELPADMMEDERKEAAAAAVKAIEADLPIDDDDETATRPAIPATPPLTQQVTTRTAGAVEPPAGVAPVAVASDATPLPKRPAPSMSKPIEPTIAPAAASPKAAAKSGSSGLLLLILVLALAGGGIYWFFFVRTPDTGTAQVTPTPPPAKTPDKPPAKTPDKPPAPAAAPVATLEQIFAEPLEAHAPADGVIAFIAPAGKDVAADEPVAKLQGFQRWEAQKNQAAGRLNFYQGELDKAKAAVPLNQAGIDRNQKKVEEKQGLLTEAEKELANLVLLAPTSGKVAPALKVGAAVKKGDVVVRITNGGPQTSAKFEVGAAASDYGAPGASCTVAQKGAPDKRAACLVIKVEGTTVTVRMVEGSPFKAGDEVELQPAKK